MKAGSTSPRRRYCIVGAGYFGLGAAKALRDDGVPYDHLAGGNGVGNTLTETLMATSSRRSIEHPDYPAPEEWPEFPGEGRIRAYLRDFAREHDLDGKIEFGRSVKGARPLDGRDGHSGWRLELEDGEIRHYAGIVLTEARTQKPRVDLPGHFSGKRVYATNEEKTRDLEDERVLVIGDGNLACAIATGIGRRSRKCYVSTRGGSLLPETLLGVPLSELEERLWWLSDERFLGRLVGPLSRMILRDQPPSRLLRRDLLGEPIVSSEALHQIRRGALEVKPEVARFDGEDVHFVDGSVSEVDAVVHVPSERDVALPVGEELLKYENGVPVRVGSVFLPGLANCYLFGPLITRGGSGRIISEGSEVLARAIRAQEELSHPLVEDLARMWPPDSRLPLSPAAVLREIRTLRRCIDGIVLYGRFRGYTAGMPPAIPPAPAQHENASTARKEALST